MTNGQNVTSALSVSADVRKASWGTVVTILVIVGVIVIGALYAWGERISEERERSGYPTDGSAGPQT